MRILRETRLVLWWLADEPSLSREARALIADPGNTLFLSAVSMWEIWLNQSLGNPFGPKVPPMA